MECGFVLPSYHQSDTADRFPTPQSQFLVTEPSLYNSLFTLGQNKGKPYLPHSGTLHLGCQDNSVSDTEATLVKTIHLSAGKVYHQC
jgi:hypothetical protein